MSLMLKKNTNKQHLTIINTMGLDSFKTDGPRTYSKKGGSKSKQAKIGTSRKPYYANDFEDKWGMSVIDALNDPEFFAERVKEGVGLFELTADLHTLPRTVVDKIIQAVDEGHLEISDIPEDEKIQYNDKYLKDYAKERIHNHTFDDNSPEPEESSNSGLDAFRS